MEQALQLLRQHLVNLTQHIGKPNCDHEALFREIDMTVGSLKEIHQAGEQTKALQDARQALAAAEEHLKAVPEISSMGTVGGSKGHAIVSAVMAKRENIRGDVHVGFPDNLRSEALLRELADILDTPPATITQPAVGAPVPHNAPPAHITGKKLNSAGVRDFPDEQPDRPEAIRQALENHLGEKRVPRAERLRLQNA